MQAHSTERDAMRARRPASRLAFALALALMMGTGTYAAYAFGVLGPDLRQEFGLSRFELGLLTTTFFLVGGSLSLVAGRATDRFGARRVMFVAFAASAGALVGMAAAPSYALMLAVAAVAGIGLASGNPVTNKLVAVNVAPGGRGLIMGGKQSGVQVGAFLAGALLAPAAAVIGWRAALGWSALVPLAGILLALAVVPADRQAVVQPGERPHGPMPRGVYWLAAYAFLMGSGVAVINAYLPLYLVERAGATQQVAGTVAATIGLVGIFSRVAWGWASERMRHYSLPLLMLGAGAVVSVLLVVAVESVGLWLAWPAAALFGASAVTWNAVGMLAVITSSGAGMAGRASGIVVFGFYIGFVASPMGFGWLVDRGADYSVAWLLVAATLSIAMLVILAWRRSEGRSAAGPDGTASG
jgi:predicted MFS family arabinose efflux permease